MASRVSALILITLSCLSFSALGYDFQPLVDDKYSCGPGPGFLPIQDFAYSKPPQCVVNPCYGNPGPCGEGNQCSIEITMISGVIIIKSLCTCTAPAVLSHIVYYDFCYVPGTDRCNPNPCKNGGTCAAVRDFNGVDGAFSCTCPDNFQGSTCELPNPAPPAVRKDGGVDPTRPPTTPPPTPTPIIYPPITGPQGVCGQPGEAFGFPQRCWFNNDPEGRYVCCDAQGCDGFNADNLVPHCKNYGYRVPNDGKIGPNPPPPPPTGNQGVCGQPGEAFGFPNRCWFNNDPLGRYVCCDNQGCDGFNADNLTPHCKNYGYRVPNDGRTGGTGGTGGGTGTGGPQGVCGTGAATDFPLRCWYNNDPMGRYVCCDNDGCNGFYSPDNFFPKCKANGFVPLNP